MRRLSDRPTRDLWVRAAAPVIAGAALFVGGACQDGPPVPHAPAADVDATPAPTPTQNTKKPKTSGAVGKVALPDAEQDEPGDATADTQAPRKFPIRP